MRTAKAVIQITNAAAFICMTCGIYSVTLTSTAETGDAAQAVAQDSEAEKLFRDMEVRISSAKAVKVVADFRSASGKATATYRTTMLFTQANKADIRSEGSAEEEGFEKQHFTFHLISDGKRMLLEAPSKSRDRLQTETSTKFHHYLVAGLSRLGPTTTALYLFRPQGRADQEKDQEQQMPLSGFKMRPPEKLDGRNTTVIRFCVGSGPKGGINTTLWLDATTSLPLKLTSSRQDMPGGTTEVFREFTIDPAIDASTFKIPEQ